ncbi:unnamed protein product [Cuscuta epithymum]|uniref:Uncharacterized protein n=1 Tax=Cuscuta epithymum TaxID=186058 RepID=A0AAV0D7Q9_9ASTE|nr:unnamed protein product [Cuscuta epithymum]
MHCSIARSGLRRTTLQGKFATPEMERKLWDGSSVNGGWMVIGGWAAGGRSTSNNVLALRSGGHLLQAGVLDRRLCSHAGILWKKAMLEGGRWLDGGLTAGWLRGWRGARLEVVARVDENGWKVKVL